MENKTAFPSWKYIRDLRRPVFDLLTPCYFLDNNFLYLDWNPAFENLIAKEFDLQIGTHGIALIQHLANGEDIMKRSLEVFAEGNNPLVDTEPVIVKYKKYGEVKFQKIASQISDEEGVKKGWFLNLNIMSAERADLLWADLISWIEDEVLWSNYAVSYDKVFNASRGGFELVDCFVKAAEKSKLSLHVGVGTGKVALKCLKENPDVMIWAIESQESMLEFFRMKLSTQAKQSGENYKKRVRHIKERARNLSQFSTASCDTILCFDGLSRVDDLTNFFKESHRILSAGGRIVLSTFHNDTKFEQFFKDLEKDLSKEATNSVTHYLNVVDTYKRLESKLKCVSDLELRNLLDNAGFKIEDMKEHPFQGGCLYVSATKK